MADDSVRVTNWPTSNTAEEVAFKLWQQVSKHEGSMQDRLMEYAECLAATRGHGRYYTPNFK